MTVTAEGAARLFLHQVWKLHGLLKYVISDRRPQFVACFTRELYRLLGIKLASSTAWYPQTDGQTECVNQELDQYLQLFVNKRQDNWYDLLPMAEFHRKHPRAPRHVRCMEFDNIFHSESIVPRHSNLEGGVNIRGHLHFYPKTA